MVIRELSATVNQESIPFCRADSYLRQLGLRMESQTEPWIVIYYFRNVLMEAGDLNDFFINRTTYESIFEAVPLLSKFDIQTVREPWAFALTGVGRGEQFSDSLNVC